MRRSNPCGVVLVVVLVVAVTLALATTRARAGDESPSPPPSSRATSAPADVESKMAKMTAEQLEKRLSASPEAAWAMNVKYVSLVAGLGVLALYVARFVRRRDERRHGMPPSRPDAAPPRAFDLGPAIALAFAGEVVVGFVGVSVYAAATGTDLRTFQIPLAVGIAATAAGTVPLAIAVAVRIRRGWAARRAVGPASPWPSKLAALEGLLAFLAASTLVFVAALVTTLVMTGMGSTPEPQDLVIRVIEPRTPYEPWLIAAFGVFVAPITEEYVFRGLLYPAIRDRSSVIFATVVSSLAFAFAHQSWTAGPALFVLAFVICRLYERTGSVWPGVMVHVLNNATSLLPLFLVR